MKAWVKFVFHWIGFLAAIVAAGYMIVTAKADNWVEHVSVATATLGALFVALNALRSVVDKQIDSMPDVPTKNSNTNSAA